MAHGNFVRNQFLVTQQVSVTIYGFWWYFAPENNAFMEGDGESHDEHYACASMACLLKLFLGFPFSWEPCLFPKANVMRLLNSDGKQEVDGVNLMMNIMHTSVLQHMLLLIL
jgi:hypothetical protein